MTDETPVFVTFDLLTQATHQQPATVRQWLWRQWNRTHRTRTDWTIATACDTTTRRLVYSLPDAMHVEAATRRSPMRRDNTRSIA